MVAGADTEHAGADDDLPAPPSLLKTQGIDDALIQPYSGHASRQSLEIYSRLAIGEAQAEYDRAIGRFPV